MSAGRRPLLPVLGALLAAGLRAATAEGDRSVAARRRPSLVVAALLALVSSASAPSCPASERDHDQALRLRQSGAILPLQAVVAQVMAMAPGRILEVELERAGDDYVYEVEILELGGTLRRLWLDARTGQVRKPPRGGLQ